MLRAIVFAAIVVAAPLAAVTMSASPGLASAIEESLSSSGAISNHQLSSPGIRVYSPGIRAPHDVQLAFVAVRRGGYAYRGRGGYAYRGGARVGWRGGGYAYRGGVAVGPRGAVAYRGGVVVGPRGGVAYRGRAVVVRNPVLVSGVYRPYGATWLPGGAIAAGAAVGFVAASSAAAWAGAPPQPNYCWYYTDASHTKGFWDACP